MWRTLIVLGSSTHAEYVDQKVFDIVKSFACLPPSQVSKTNDIIQFDIPVSQISGHVDSTCAHSIETDGRCSRLKTESIRTISRNVSLFLQHPASKQDYDRITIHRQHVFRDSFLLKDSATFSNVKYIKERVDASIHGWESEWTIRFQEQWICPYYSLGEPDLYIFRCRPLCSIHVIVDGLPEIAKIRDFMHVAFPLILRGKYVPKE